VFLPRSYLAYRGFRYLAGALVLLAASCALYAAFPGPRGRAGDTVVGYALGSLAAGLVVWLMGYARRKRSYGVGGAPLRGWLSGHVYLGSALLVLVPLHSGFELGWSVHGLAFCLVIAAVFSGMLGVFVYAGVPAAMAANRTGQSLGTLFEEIANLDTEAQRIAMELSDAHARILARAIGGTRIGGGIFRQLSGRDPRCATERALRELDPAKAGSGADPDPAEHDRIRRVVEVLSLKAALLSRVRRDARQRAILDLWLLSHLSLAVAAAAAIAVHVFSVFYYR